MNFETVVRPTITHKDSQKQTIIHEEESYLDALSGRWFCDMACLLGNDWCQTRQPHQGDPVKLFFS